jgi:hypothetical protein
MECQSIQVYHHDPAFPIGGAELPSVAGAPTSLVVTLCAVSSSVSEGGRPLHNVLTLMFRSLMEISTIFFAISSSTVFLKILQDVFSFLRRSCSFKPVPYAVVAFRLRPTSALSGFLVQHCPCLVPDYRVPCAVQKWHGASSLCGRRPTTSSTHHRPRPVSSAVGGPYG